jgi:hypothetical protein
MTATTTVPSASATPDKDLAEQARSGHGIPSQDPDPAAQSPLRPEEAAREANSTLAGGGVVGGAVIGAAVGVVVGGPVGVVVGGTLGAVAGAVGGQAAGTAMNPVDAGHADPRVERPVPTPVDHSAAAVDVKR